MHKVKQTGKYDFRYQSRNLSLKSWIKKQKLSKKINTNVEYSV